MWCKAVPFGLILRGKLSQFDKIFGRWNTKHSLLFASGGVILSFYGKFYACKLILVRECKGPVLVGRGLCFGTFVSGHFGVSS